MPKQPEQTNNPNLIMGCLILVDLYFIMPAFLIQCATTSSTISSSSSYSGSNIYSNSVDMNSI